jgi:hypothetical protein
MASKDKAPSNHTTVHGDDDYENSPYLYAPDFRDVSPGMEHVNDKDETESKAVSVLVFKVLTSNLNELNKDKIKTINEAIEIISTVTLRTR